MCIPACLQFTKLFLEYPKLSHPITCAIISVSPTQFTFPTCMFAYHEKLLVQKCPNLGLDRKLTTLLSPFYRHHISHCLLYPTQPPALPFFSPTFSLATKCRA